MEGNPLYINLLPVKRIYTLASITFPKGSIHTIKATSDWTIYIINAGSLSFSFNKERLFLQPGECLIIDNKNGYSFQTASDEEVQAVTITFTTFIDDHSLDPLKETTLKFSEHQKQLIRNLFRKADIVYEALSENIYDLRQHKKEVDVIEEKILYLHFSELIYTLIQKFQRESQRPLSDKPKEDRHEMVAQILSYMEENLDKNLSVEDFASHFFISPSYIKKIFKEHTGYSMINYYKTLKMERAKDLIHENTMNFTDIGLALGYDSIHHFSNAFKKHTGLSPTKYKLSIELVNKRISQLN